MGRENSSSSAGMIAGIGALVGLGFAIYNLCKARKQPQLVYNKTSKSSYERKTTMSDNNGITNYNDEERYRTSQTELNEMIGLHSVKDQLDLIKASFKKQQILGNKMNLNLCFYGNPGTGKTEVARLFAKILYENGILPTDKFIETDRSGLVGEYIGTTSIKTHETFKKALGGVLFIDEAYSLHLESSHDYYGAEAVQALLKDMEDYRGQICVILAGYKDEMNSLFDMNPGFRSRISNYIDFPNYSKDEISKIIRLIARKEKYTIDDDALDLMTNIAYSHCYETHYANAREARNVFEHVRDLQARRTYNSRDTRIKLIDVLEYKHKHKES